MTRRARRLGLGGSGPFGLAAIGALLLAALPAAAATCSDTAVTARGEPALTQWLALLKARGNWRSKVRTLPDLGAQYANWSRAADAVERCISDGQAVVCSVTGRPCRP